jgi:hypothetical protein
MKFGDHLPAVRRAAIVATAAILCLSAGLWLRAHTLYTTKITWSNDVSRIVYRNCVSCHHPGGSSFSLMSYREARPWAEDIKLQVLERRMPPWNAVKGFGEFKNDHGLTQEDLEIVGEWVDGGAPEGNPLYMPPPPVDLNTGIDRQESHSHERRLVISGTETIKRAITAVGIEPGQVPETGALQVVARCPDGAVEPLIWVEKFNSGYKTTYYFQDLQHFPAGTRIEVSPPQASAALLVK